MKLAKFVADVASDIKAENIVLLDMRKVANFCDYFLICSGNSSRHVKAIAEAIDEKLSDWGSKIAFIQGVREGKWVIIDLGSVVAHIFDKETRSFYGLEYLWQDAAQVKIE